MFYYFKNGKTYLNIKATTRAGKNYIRYVKNSGELSICVTAIPENNKANIAIIDLLSKKLKIAKSKICIASGEKCKNKKICIEEEINSNILQVLNK